MFNHLDSFLPKDRVKDNIEFMKYLLVVAHPDDEVLGAGASMKERFMGYVGVSGGFRKYQKMLEEINRL